MKKETRENIESILEVTIEEKPRRSPIDGYTYVRPIETFYVINYYKNKSDSELYQICKRPYKTKYPILKKIYSIKKELVNSLMDYINNHIVIGDPLKYGLVKTVTQNMSLSGIKILNIKILSKDSLIYKSKLLDFSCKKHLQFQLPEIRYELNDNHHDEEFIVFLWDMKKKRTIKQLYYKDKFLALPDNDNNKQNLVLGDFHKEIMDARFRIREDKNVVFLGRYYLLLTIPFGTYMYNTFEECD